MKNKILIAINFIMAIIFIISVCCLDSESNIFFITALASGAYLTLSAYANGLFGKLVW